MYVQKWIDNKTSENRQLVVDDELEQLALSLNRLARIIYEGNKANGFWTDLKTGLPVEPTLPNIMTKLMLIVTEVAEAAEGVRKDLFDDHLPYRTMFETELADALIRILDAAGGLGLDIGRAVVEKLVYNRSRQDHKIETRMAEGGKKV